MPDSADTRRSRGDSSPDPRRPGADAASACTRPAKPAGQVDTAFGRVSQSRSVAAGADGTPQLQARYAGAGEGRNREQEAWQQHQARVTASAGPVADHAQDGPAEPGTVQPRPGTPVAVTLSRPAAGSDGCLAVRDPIGRWLVDDVPVQSLPAAPAAP